MIDHLSLGVKELKRSVSFYDAVLGALGYQRLWITEKAAGWGIPPGTNEKFAVMQEDKGVIVCSSPESHIAFTSDTNDNVRRFFDEAMKNGGTDQTGVGPRPEYGPRYFAAYVLDPDGYQIEAVCNTKG